MSVCSNSKGSNAQATQSHTLLFFSTVIKVAACEYKSKNSRGDGYDYESAVVTP